MPAEPTAAGECSLPFYSPQLIPSSVRCLYPAVICPRLGNYADRSSWAGESAIVTRLNRCSTIDLGHWPLMDFVICCVKPTRYFDGCFLHGPSSPRALTTSQLTFKSHLRCSDTRASITRVLFPSWAFPHLNAYLGAVRLTSHCFISRLLERVLPKH